MIFSLAFSVALSATEARWDNQCPAANDHTSLTSWRLAEATGLQNQSTDDGTVAGDVATCFAAAVPACVQPLAAYAGRNDVADPEGDVAAGASPEKTPPKEFLAPDGDGHEYVLPANVEALAAQRGWPAVRYKSRHSGGFDPETASLLMVYVPGDKVTPPVAYDQWLNFALPADSGDDALKPAPQAHVPTTDDYANESEDESLPRTFTIVTLDHPTAAAGGKAQVYFQKYHRRHLGDAKFTAEGNSDVTSCYSCHASGMRAISPLGYHVRAGEAQLDPAAWKATKTINDAMDSVAGDATVSWRSVDGKPLLKPDAQGPIVGALTPMNPDSRSQAFIMGGTGPSGAHYDGCYKSRTTIDVSDIFGREPGRDDVYTLSSSPQIRWEKIRDAMQCAGCHDGSFRGTLNGALSLSELDFKLVVDQSMPFGAHQDPLDQGSPTAPVRDDLTPDERIALANCLRDELALEQGRLAQWLTQTSCQ